MDAVIKIGGSLGANPPVLRKLCETIGALAEKYQLLVVPGGGEFADVVREIDKRYSLSPSAAHRMAILGMDQYGLLLRDITPNSREVQTLAEARSVSQAGEVPILLPSLLIFGEKPFEASWNVTSDSIAAYVANRVNAPRLVLATDVDGIFNCDPKLNSNAKLLAEVQATEILKRKVRTSVDRYLPKVLLEAGVDCFVINGAYPERIEAVLANKTTLCTHILSK